MARPLRLELAGAWYHVSARGNERRAIFRGLGDRLHFLGLLEEGVERFGWLLHGYVLMDNHFHLMLETPEPNLSRGMQWLGVSYSVWFNRRHRRSGHLFQGRFKAIVVDPLSWAVALSRYLHLNPVRVGRLGLGKAERAASRLGMSQPPDRGLVRERMTTLRNYRWSSYRAYVGLEDAPEWLHCEKILELGGGPARMRQQAYQKYVEEGIRQGLEESPWEKLQGQLVLGPAEFVKAIQRRLRGNRREQTSLRRMERRPALREIIEVVEGIKGQAWRQFRDQHGDWGRDLVLYLGRRRGGLKLRELVETAGGIDYVSVSMAIKRFAQRLRHDRRLAEAVNAADAKLAKNQM